jgi:hypothetical protein
MDMGLSYVQSPVDLFSPSFLFLFSFATITEILSVLPQETSNHLLLCGINFCSGI